MRNDLINDAVTTIKNYERIGKGECTVKPISKLLIDILRVFQKEGYVGEFELINDRRGNSIKIKLNNKINDCGVIKPRSPVKNDEFGEWEKRFLPAKDFGVLVVTTPKGVMTHKEARLGNLGGRLLAYVY